MQDRYRAPHGESKHVPNGQAVVGGLFSETNTALIKEITRANPLFKFMAETAEPGEPAINTFVYGMGEEMGIEIEVERNQDGNVTRITDPRFTFKHMLQSHWVTKSHFRHRRHFFGLVAADEFVRSLDGKKVNGDKGEIFLIQVFRLSDLENLQDFLPAHRKLIEAIHNPNLLDTF